MCGLFGAFEPEGLSAGGVARADAARDTLAHRGPDQWSSWVSGGLYVGHRRLSIIDLSEDARQPMVSADGRIVMTVNGEIYNFKPLRAELEAKGCRFASKSDSEVVLHGYRIWGLEGLCERIDGMYVATIFDTETNQLHIIRDRSGIKPLYYFHRGRRFAWASELKAIREWVGAENLAKDNSAVFDFLVYRYIPAPKSLYRDVHKLPPASVLTFDLASGRADVRKYWSLPVSERQGSDDEFAEELRHLLRQSVSEQMVADVPLGFLLSGGIDSSAITAMGASLASQPLTFTIGFNNSARNEAPFAELVAKKMGTRHLTRMFDADDMDGLEARMEQWFDEPFGDTSAVPTFRVAETAREHVTVALTGDGGDELFGGYNKYKMFADIDRIQKHMPFGFAEGLKLAGPARLRKRLELYTIHDPVALYGRMRWGTPAYRLGSWRARLEIPRDYDPYWAFRPHFRRDLPARKALQVVDFHTNLPDDMLTKVDRVSMAVALECRPPMLSRALIEFAFSLPESFLYKGGALKGGLKYAMRGILPPEILNRGKQGFSVPDFGWRRSLEKKSGTLAEALAHASLAEKKAASGVPLSPL